MKLDALYKQAINIYPEDLYQNIGLPQKKDILFLTSLSEQIKKLKPEFNRDDILTILKKHTLKEAFEKIENLKPELKENGENKEIEKKIENFVVFLKENFFEKKNILLGLENKYLEHCFNKLSNLSAQIDEYNEQQELSDIEIKSFEYLKKQYKDIKKEILLFSDLENKIDNIMTKGNKMQRKK